MRVERANKSNRIAIQPKYRNVVGLIKELSKLPAPVFNVKFLAELEKIKQLR
jgi:hypothetical protein